MSIEKPLYRIGEAAIRCGVTAANIRFYEKEGLFQPGERSSNSYRGYTDRDVHQLKFIGLRTRCDGTGPKCRVIEALHHRADQLLRQEPRSRGHRHV